MKVMIIPARHTEALVLRDLDPAKLLKELNQAVGGYIEHIPLPTREVTFIGDEEGRCKGKPDNVRATLLWRSIWDCPIRHPLVGDIVVAGPIVDGELTDIPAEVAEQLECISHGHPASR